MVTGIRRGHREDGDPDRVRRERPGAPRPPGKRLDYGDPRLFGRGLGPLGPVHGAQDDKGAEKEGGAHDEKAGSTQD